MPTLILTSAGDRAVLTESDLQQLTDLHDIAPEDMLHIGTSNPNDSSRVPMLTNTKEFNSRLLDWIEETL